MSMLQEHGGTYKARSAFCRYCDWSRLDAVLRCMFLRIGRGLARSSFSTDLSHG